ncbi:MAG: Bax inhibitor-1/YccA family protein [Chitinophagaceae bacterium]|nr:MAG: Bax inhibitor-1/YccA family protein [Chitinophagaceae bacterium]
MERQNYQDNSVFVIEEGAVSKKFFANVFLWMFVALSLSAGAAYFMASSTQEFALLSDPETGGRTVLGYVAMFAPLGLVLLMGAGFNRLSYPTLLAAFIAFSVLLGVSLSYIFFRFTDGSIAACFAGAAGIFAVMAFLGYTTDVDLSKFGPILMIGVVGLIIASVVNMFLNSPTMYYILSFAGVAIFTALTAYDVQKIKRIGMGIEENGGEIAAADTKKLVLMAALTLYLDFINIFIYLLQIFGSRR